MKLITRDTDYALRALCCIAKNKKEKVFSVSFLIGKLGVPGPFLRKLLQVLHNQGILKSFKGKGGGFSLAKKSRDIFLTDLMRIFQGRFCLNECRLKKGICPHIRGCPLRAKVLKIEKYVRKELSSVTVASLLKGD